MRTGLAAVAALLMVLGTGGTAEAKGKHKGWHARTCVTAADAVTIAKPGTPQGTVEQTTGPGREVMRDYTVYGVSYPTCSTTDVFVVLYGLRSRTVFKAIYAPA